MIQRGCQRAVEAVVEPGDEADSPDKEDVPVTKNTSSYERRRSTRRKLNMMDENEDDAIQQEGKDVVAFARRSAKQRDIKAVKGKEAGEMSRSAKNTGGKEQEEGFALAKDTLAPKRAKRAVEGQGTQGRATGKGIKRAKKQALLPGNGDQKASEMHQIQSYHQLDNTGLKDRSEGAKTRGEEVGTADGHLVPSPPSNPREQRRVASGEGPKSPVNTVENPFHAICRWLTKSLVHPLSLEAEHAKIRPALQEAVDYIHQNVKTTIEQSFNNSVLVVGAPGSGKSMAVSRVCRLVEKEWNTVKDDPKVGIVRLSGLAFSDEKSAFRELARQLCAVLNLEYLKHASYGENIKFLLAILRALASANKAALFILEDFELFAQTQKQTFLYCLLDSLQKSNAKAIVIGTTCRHDCLDLLEKRVRSRFSHRTVPLVPPTKAVEKKDIPSYNDNGALGILMSMLMLPPGVYPDPKAADEHNKKVQDAFANQKVVDSVSQLFETSNSLHQLSNIAKKSLYLSCKRGYFCRTFLLQALESQRLASMKGFEQVISKLCPLDLAVLAAAYKVRTCRQDGILNFEMIHHEFRSFFAMGHHVDNYSKVAAMKSFEHLISQGILRYPRDKSGPLCRRDRNYAQVSLQITREELLQGFDNHFHADIRLRDWCQKDGGPSTTALQTFA